MTAKAKKIEELELQLACLTEDIRDHLDESPVHSLLVTEDVDTAVSRAESLRTLFRTEQQQLKKLAGESYEDDYGNTYSDELDRIKKYITAAKDVKQKFRVAEVNVKQCKENHEFTKNSTATTFLCTELNRGITDLTNFFSKSLKVDDNGKEVPDEEITRFKEALPEATLELERLSTKYTTMLDVIPDNYPNREVVTQNLNKKYENLIVNKTRYISALEAEIKVRDISKAKSFQQSKLNIKLEPFKGYGSSTDIYTFQSAFEKKYLKNTPKYHLPDVLKNNHLENPAKDLVRELEDIDEIWGRLHKSYGDPKVLLKMKLAAVSKIGPLNKLRDSGIFKNALVNLINSMKDLIKLSTKHKVTEKLYHGDGMATIYRIMGNSSVNKWLTSIAGEDVSEADQWKRLILFLEKELSIHERKSLVLGDDSNSNSNESQRSNRSSHYGYNGGGDNSNSSRQSQEKCSFCDEEEHVKTNGPNGSKIIQYFACRKFHDSTPAQRFRELRSRGLCVQCLYPGATQSNGKHSSGKCQSIFTCKHGSHERHPVKKHVLVCQEHSETQDNQQLLEEYKRKCILSQRIQLEEFSKEIKLSFTAISYTSKPTTTPKVIQQPGDDDIVTEDAVYILQTILVDEEPYNLFFDNGCGEFLSMLEAIKRIGKRATLERAGPSNLGGVGDTKTIAD